MSRKTILLQRLVGRLVSLMRKHKDLDQQSMTTHKDLDQHSVTTKLTILQLPTEILLLIVESLPLYSKVFISQTCRLLRATFNAICVTEVKKLAGIERTRFLAAIALARPDVWPCAACDGYHPIDITNTPSSPYNYSYCECPLLGERLGKHAYGTDYTLNHAHVHFALKLRRFEKLPKSYSTYLTNLMAPFETSGLEKGQLTTKYRVRPRIVASRFLLFSHWELAPLIPQFKPKHLPFWTVCPHLTVSPYGATNHDPFMRSINAAFGSRSELQSGACHRCLTDFEVQVQPLASDSLFLVPSFALFHVNPWLHERWIPESATRSVFSLPVIEMKLIVNRKLDWQPRIHQSVRQSQE